MIIRSCAVLLSFLTASLLTPITVNACSIHFKVVNQSGYPITSLAMTGPWGRQSKLYDLDGHAGSFDYHAEGSVFSCHGSYKLKIFEAQKYIIPDGIQHNFSKDADVTVTITNQCRQLGPHTVKQCTVKWSPSETLS